MDMFEQKRCKSMMTRAEAEFIMKKEVPERAFWIVDCFCNNYNRLQDVLDVLYNTLPGNDYSVSYLASQKGTRLVIFCQVCRIELTSFGPFSSHNNGKSHKRRQQQAASTKSVNKGRTLEHRRLNEPKGIFLKGSLEDLIDSTRFIILGVQFVYKECICGQYCFTCQLCQGDCEVERVNASTMFTHLRSVVHNKKYMAS
ncbi:uncharacterized protein [Procambarus clarkii]|uniref:uncharacterized protein isoform X1 n=1 Tax=Procambarus clarkii TaxID=6728 RepID=UPI003743908A